MFLEAFQKNRRHRENGLFHVLNGSKSVWLDHLADLQGGGRVCFLQGSSNNFQNLKYLQFMRRRVQS